MGLCTSLLLIAAVPPLALILAIPTLEEAPPADPDSPRDPLAPLLAAVGCVAAFFGSSQLTGGAFLDPIVIIPLLGGLGGAIPVVLYVLGRARRGAPDIEGFLAGEAPPGTHRHRRCGCDPLADDGSFITQETG